MHTTLHSRRRASWRQHFIAVARACEALPTPAKAGTRPGVKALRPSAGRQGCAASHS